ncbi:unnamed protein product [Candidula unifasciata]|uniref:Uncharacterized protein n=1 Tax=Candidula unifasciata TaxID=100452 RepID=A0A8S4A0J6_9EUPU|nr:unnamed protein product [Candidula unifasciata]
MAIQQQNTQQQQQQQTLLPDLKQKSQQQQQQQQQQQPRQSQSHHPPQTSPHNLRPPSASTTPLPSPKLHASPGSASNAGSVHSMSPAAQQHSCQKQQQNSQMSSGSMIDRVNAPPLSHPPQQSPSLSQLFSTPDTSPRNSSFTSPPSGGSSMKLKHMSPSNAQSNQEQSSSFISTQKGGSFSQASAQQPKNQYSVDKIIEHPNNTSSSVQSRHPSDSFNFTNIGSNVTTTTAIPSSGTMPLTSDPSGSGFSFSLSSTNPHQSSCSANINTSSNNSNSGSVSSMQSVPPPSGAHVTHNTPYLNPFFPPPPPMNLPSSAGSSSHHSLAMHPLGNMEIQHPTSRPSSGSSTAAAYGIGPSSLMTFGSHPKLDIPPISKSPTYNTNNLSSNNNPSGSTSNSINTGKSPSAGSSSSNNGSYSHTSSKQSIDANSSRYQASKSTAESIYQQQQKRPNTIQHPPASMSHMDSMARLSSSAHNNSFFPMGFPASSSASLSSASMPLRHLPDTRDISSRTPYDYPPVPHHPAMGFPHPHSQLSSGYGTHPSFARDCARLEASHHQQQQQQQTQHQQQQQSPRKQTTPKKSSTSSSAGSSSNTGNSNAASGGSSSSTSSHRGGGGSSGTGSGSGMNQDHSHSPAASSSRVTASQHHSSQQQNTGSSSTNSSSHSRSSSSAQKRKTTSSSSSSKKKSTASQHTGFPVDSMDANMSQSMFDSSFPYLNFPTLAQSMSPPAARPHQADTPFLGGMFNTQPRPIANSSAKTADMTASHFPLFPSRAQNSFFQPAGFGMNSMTGNHGNPTAGISPHSMGVPPHMSAFGLFGNDTTGAPDNISSNKFLHTNPILPGSHQTMDHSLQHGHQAAASLYHTRPHSAQSHMMAAFYQHGFDTRSHMGQPFNGSMGPPPFHTPGLPPINFSMHDTH